MIVNPFPGPRPYRADERARLFAREDLSYRLQIGIQGHRAVTVYGPPGAGRASLMRASVLPAVVGDHQADVVSMNGWPEDEDPTGLLARVLYAELALSYLPSDLPAAEQVVGAAQRAARRSSRMLILYLDRVEQLLDPGRAVAATDALFSCLSELAALPIRNVRLVLSLREEALGLLHDRLREHPRLLDHAARVAPLTIAEMAGAACRAAALGTPAQSWSAAEALALMRTLRAPGQVTSDDSEVRMTDAQIACRALFQERAEGAVDPT